MAIVLIEPGGARAGGIGPALREGLDSFLLSLSYGLYVQRTSSVILISTIASVATISVFYALFPPTV